MPITKEYIESLLLQAEEDKVKFDKQCQSFLLAKVEIYKDSESSEDEKMVADMNLRHARSRKWIAIGKIEILKNLWLQFVD